MTLPSVYRLQSECLLVASAIYWTVLDDTKANKLRKKENTVPAQLAQICTTGRCSFDRGKRGKEGAMLSRYSQRHKAVRFKVSTNEP